MLVCVNRFFLRSVWVLGAILTLLVACRTAPDRMIPNENRRTVESVETMSRVVAGHQLSYLMQAPSGPAPEGGWPLLLFLHGYGECGDDIEKVRKHGPPKLIQRFSQLQGCVIVSPQCPSDSWWRVDALRALVDEVVANRGDIDRSRLYVTGLSMGGYGIWSFISRYPEYFAAAVPICGGGDPFHLPANRPPEKVGVVNEFDPVGLRTVRSLPVWSFHGADDGSVPLSEGEMMVSILRDGGNKSVNWTVYDGVGHVGAWERAYESHELWEWIFAQ